MVSKQDMILKIVEKIDTKSDKQGEKLAGIEQHLATLNGTVTRHERLIDENRKYGIKNQVTLAKLVGPGLAGGGIVGVLIYILQLLVK